MSALVVFGVGASMSDRRIAWVIYAAGLAILTLTGITYLKHAVFMLDDFRTYYNMSSPSLEHRLWYQTADLYWRPFQENLMGLFVADLGFNALTTQLVTLVLWWGGLLCYFKAFLMATSLDKPEDKTRQLAFFIVICLVFGLSRSFRENVWFLQTGYNNGTVFALNGAILLVAFFRDLKRAPALACNAALALLLACVILSKESGAVSIGIPFAVTGVVLLSEKKPFLTALLGALYRNAFLVILPVLYFVVRVLVLHIPLSAGDMSGYLDRAIHIVVEWSAGIFVEVFKNGAGGIERTVLVVAGLIVPPAYLLWRGYRLTVLLCILVALISFVPIPAPPNWGHAVWLPPAAPLLLMLAYALCDACRLAFRGHNAVHIAVMLACVTPLAIMAIRVRDDTVIVAAKKAEWNKIVAALVPVRDQILEANRSGAKITTRDFLSLQGVDEGLEFIYTAFANEFGQKLRFPDNAKAAKVLELVYTDLGSTARIDAKLSDVVVDVGPPMAALDRSGEVDGYVENFGVRAGVLHVAGWAYDRHDKAPLISLLVYVNGEFAGHVPLTISRPDVSQAKQLGFETVGFDHRVDLPSPYDGKPMLIQVFAETTDGTHALLPCISGSCEHKITDIQKW